MAQPISPEHPGAGSSGSVGGSPAGRYGGSWRSADLVDQLVGGRSRRATTPCSVNVPIEPGDVGRLADLDLVVRGTGEQCLEVGAVGGDRVHVPAGQVGRGRPLALGDLLQQAGEVVDGPPPDVDVAGQSGLVGVALRLAQEGGAS